jgi:REP element-mobilizing transposase RayT
MPRVTFDPNLLVFITTVTHQRQLLFRDIRLVERLGTMIHMACRLKGFAPLTYAILPDHFHLLVCSDRLKRRTLERVRRIEPNLVQSDGADSSYKTKLDLLMETGELSSPPAKEVGALMQSIKGTFSRTLPHGQVWQRRYHHWIIGDTLDAYRVVEYIVYNYRHTRVPKRYGKEPFVWRDNELIGSLLS